MCVRPKAVRLSCYFHETWQIDISRVQSPSVLTQYIIKHIVQAFVQVQFFFLYLSKYAPLKSNTAIAIET